MNGMGILSDLFRGTRPDYLASSPSIASPWADSSHLKTFAISEALGLELANLPIDRDQAMSLPSVALSRHKIAGDIARLPLVAVNAQGRAAKQPTFLYRTDTNVSCYQRMLWTMDSLFFYGAALWAVRRGADGSILDAAWIPQDEWSFDGDGRILVQGTPVDESEVILFNGPTQGLIHEANRTIRQGLSIEEAREEAYANPIPGLVIEHVNQGDKGAGEALEDTEIADLLTQWNNRKYKFTGYLPPELKVTEVGKPIDPEMFNSAETANRRAIAGHARISVSELDAPQAEASLTYSTKEGERSAYFAHTLPFWTAEIEARLSMDDVTPHKTAIRFDFGDIDPTDPTPTGPAVIDEEAPLQIENPS